MSVIDSYLDTLFAPYPDSPRMRSARTELRAMMEDKQQELMDNGHSEAQAVGTVIAEFGSLEEVAPVLGIDREIGADHGPRFGRDGAAFAEAPIAQAPADPVLDTDRARQYVQAVRAAQPISAFAIPLFVLCPVPLLALIAFTSPDTDPPNWVVVTGLVSLLGIIALGVLLLILRGSRLADFEDIADGRFTPAPDLHEYAQELRRTHRRSATLALSVAIALWILSAVPILVLGNMTGEGMLPLLGVCGTLMMVALGLLIYIHSSWADSAASDLEQETEDLPETSTSPAVRVIAAVYWPLATAIYLGWSFATGDWGSTWVVWPVAGVLYGALWAANSALEGGTTDHARR